ncbi:MAG TPA: LysR family transcriptional regulator, partial [Desulfovibrio sp.]|nr:LysR family transcriptional regulator [Desulfovibrio sp.]
MDIRVLKYFLTVAREESISKAAEVLHMTQPPLSRQLKDLEEEIGKQLLIRGNKRIKLTEDGILLSKRAEEIIELMEKTKTELSSSDTMMNGNIYFGSAETEVVSIIADIAKQLQEKYPLIRYNLY